MASSSSQLPSSLGGFSCFCPSPLSSSLTSEMKDGEYRNWAELPSEITSSILHRLGSVEILENAQKVCTSWRRVCKDPAMWRKIDMHNLGDLENDLEIMCRQAVDRSQGSLVEIDIWYFGSDSLLRYIADSSSILRSLKVAMCSQITNEGLTEAVVNLPLLEDLEVSYCSLSGEYLKVVGQSCPNLKTLKVNHVGFMRPRFESNCDALAIAETMHGLCHLQLFGNKLTNAGLNAILDNCHNLEHLDLRQCFFVKLVGDLEKRCSERIKVFRRPNDSTHDYPYDATVYNDIDSSEDDYPYDENDMDLYGDDYPYMTDVNYYPDFGGASDHSDYDPYDFDHDPYDIIHNLRRI